MPKLTRELLEYYNSKTQDDTESFIKVGMNTCSISSGGEKIYNALIQAVKEKNIPIKIKKCGCIGLCHCEPVIEVKNKGKASILYGNIDVDKALKILEGEFLPEFIIKDNPYQTKIVLRNCGIIDPENIEDYLDSKGYQALSKVIFEITPEQVIQEIKTSGIRGRGGAGFPTWLKWDNTRKVEVPADLQSKLDPGQKSRLGFSTQQQEMTNALIANQNNEKFIICNGDEGDPGAYMDRSVLEGDPHSVVEGMMIAGHTIGASKGYFYIRAEYPLAIERIQKAIDQCYEYGILGEKILDSDFNFDIEIRLGAGAFVCGEETALIASIEGRRGYPRPRPPYPAYKGLWGKPTVINNVETLANIPYIISEGGEKYSQVGTEASKGTKVFALTGKIKNSCLAEIPMGTTLRDVIFKIGGGIAKNKKFKAVQTGGPSGGMIPEKYLDTPISYENLQELGSIMGSGGMIVMDEDDCIVDVAKFFIKFCVDESCGKCSPCRIGTAQALRILEKITEGKGEIEDIAMLKKICLAMKEAALCGLGQTAPNPLLSSLKYFEDEYIEHIEQGKCRAGKCRIDAKRQRRVDV